MESGNIFKTKIVIEPWMREDLKLRGDSLFIYAILYSVQKSHPGKVFNASTEEINNIVNCGETNVVHTLGYICGRGLIEAWELGDGDFAVQIKNLK